MFFVNGATYASWVARIPAIRDALALRDRTLGVVLLFAGLGAIAAFRVAAKAIHRFGSRSITHVFALAFCALLPLVGFAPSAWSLALALFVAGFASGMMDVAMNENAVMVEKALGRSVLAAIHGVFSAGGLAGAISGALAARIGSSPPVHFLLASAALFVVALVAGRHLLDTRRLPPLAPSPSDTSPSPSPSSTSDSSPASSPSPASSSSPAPLPTTASLPPAPTPDELHAERRTLLGLGTIAACSSVGEGAMADWTAVYLADTLHTTADVAALGFAAYSLAMLTGRFAGDRITARLGERTAVRTAGMLVTGGLAIGLATHSLVLFFAGVTATGLGLSGLVPIVFRAAGRLPHTAPGAALATIATLSYGGFLLGPPTIGLLAEQLSLRVALVVVCVLALVIVALARLVEPRDHAVDAEATTDTHRRT